MIPFISSSFKIILKFYHHHNYGFNVKKHHQMNDDVQIPLYKKSVFFMPCSFPLPQSNVPQDLQS
jgi:hypothetical protein